MQKSKRDSDDDEDDENDGDSGNGEDKEDAEQQSYASNPMVKGVGQKKVEMRRSKSNR